MNEDTRRASVFETSSMRSRYFFGGGAAFLGATAGLLVGGAGAASAVPSAGAAGAASGSPAAGGDEVSWAGAPMLLVWTVWCSDGAFTAEFIQRMA